MKSLVIYKTKAGHTQRYAEMIAQAIESESISLEKAVGMDISNYRLLIYGGRLHAVGIHGYKTFKGLIPSFQIGKAPRRKGSRLR